MHATTSTAKPWLWLLRLLTIGMRRSRNRNLVRKLAAVAGYPSGRLQTRCLREVVDEAGEVRLVALDQQAWNVDGYELMALCALVRDRSPKTVFEFGTFDGRTTINLLRNCEATITTLDWSPEHEVWMQRLDQDGRIERLYGDSRTIDLSRLKDAVDFVFVDGGHALDIVGADTKNALMMARRGGMVVWHDYGVFPDVTQVVDEALHRTRGLAYRIERTTLAVLEMHI